MNRACDQLLANAAFSTNQDRGLGLSDTPNLGNNFVQPFTLANEFCLDPELILQTSILGEK
jgi:hypothetical protein